VESERRFDNFGQLPDSEMKRGIRKRSDHGVMLETPERSAARLGSGFVGIFCNELFKVFAGLGSPERIFGALARIIFGSRDAVRGSLGARILNQEVPRGNFSRQVL
jgi:hypothetical protein